MTRGRLPQRAGLPCLNGGGAAATVPPETNESDIVNRQSGGKKLKYVLKFYIGGTHHVISCMCNDDSALCLRARGLWQNILETGIKCSYFVLCTKTKSNKET